MVIAPTDLKIYYSGSTSKNGPGGPQGGVISTNQVPVQTLTGGVTIDNTVFEDVTSQESSTGKTRYVCLYLKNTHGSQTASNVRIYQSSITPGQDTIRMGYSGVAANGHDPLLTETNTSTYNVPLSTSESRLDHDRERAGFYIASQRAPIYNKAITLVELWLSRTGSPTGTLNVRQRSKNSSTVRTDFGSINVTTIATTPTLYQFSAPGNTFKSVLEGIIAAEYTNGSENNYISVMRAAGSPIPYMHVVNYDGDQWRNVSDFDLCGRLYTAGTGGDQLAPTGVNFENPQSIDTAITLPNLAAGAFVPFWLQNNIPANTPNQTNNTSEIAVRVTSPTP
jgi:hypothetical protein